MNSTGVVTIKGQQVLMAVLTQHDSDFQSGINLTQSLAQALVPLVVTNPKTCVQSPSTVA